MNQYHVGVAAEAFAAALISQADYDVSVQYGANQPEYDLLISRGNDFMKVSVKGSQDGGWGLIQSYKKGRTYNEAIDHWAALHTRNLIFCFVQFQGVELGAMPRVYLAKVSEIARYLKASRGGFGNTTLEEFYQYKKGVGKGYTDVIPKEWQFSFDRINQLFKSAA